MWMSSIVNTDKLKGLAELIPLAAAVLLALGYLELEFYYRLFDIQIVKYLDPSELIFSFLPTMSFIITRGVSLFLPYALIVFISFRMRSSLVYGGLPIALLFLFLYPYFPLSLRSIDERITETAILIAFAMAYYSLACIIFLLRRMKTFNDKGARMTRQDAKETIQAMPDALTRFITIMIVVTSFIAYRADLIHRNLVQDLGAKHDVTLTFTDGKVVTTDSLVFIGSTRNYYFFRDEQANANLVIPKSSVTNERIVKVRNSL
jgi:hypothetical protein